MKKLSALRPSAAAFLLMMAMAVTSSALSFFVSPVCADLDIGRGTFGLYYSLMTAAGAVSTAFIGQYVGKKGVKNVILLSALWCTCGLLLFSIANSVWMFYLVGAAMGLFGTGCIYLCGNVIMQQSYTSSQASSLLGFVMAGSGVSGMIFSLILPGILETFGWRMGYRFLAVCWLVLALSGYFLLDKQEDAQTAGSMGNRKAMAGGMTRAEALGSPKFYLMATAMILFTAGCGIQQQLPSLLEGMDFSAAQVGVMISVMTASLAVGKIAQGLIYSKVGMHRGAVVIGLMYAAGFVLLTQRGLVYPGLICLAFGMGIISTLMPTASRFVFGAREFAAIWSLLSTCSSIGSFVTTPVWGMVYDGFGSYTPALIVAPVLMLVGLGSLLMAFKGMEQ